MPVPTPLSEEEIFESFRGPRAPGGSWMKQQERKAFALITVGLKTEAVTEELPNGKIKSLGYPFWYSIIAYELESGIASPKQEYEFAKDKDTYWRKIKQQQRNLEQQERKLHDPSAKNIQFRLKGSGTSIDERLKNVKEKAEFYKSFGIDPSSRKVSQNEYAEIIERIGDVAKSDFIFPEELPQADLIYDPTGKRIHPDIIRDLQKAPHEFLSEPSSSEEVIDYSKLIQENPEKADSLWWIKSSKAWVPQTEIPGWYFNPKTDLEEGLDEMDARKKAIYGMLAALRSRFWTLPMPVAESGRVQKEWPGLHDLLMQKLATANLNTKKLITAAMSEFDTSLIAVGILIPTGIEEIFDSKEGAFRYIEQIVMDEDEPLQLAATIGNKMKITAEKAKILIEAASILEEADPSLAIAVDHVLVNALNKQQISEDDVIRGLLRVADKLDLNGASEEARFADSIIQELSQKKIQ